MDEFFDFLTDNPVAAIFIFWFLYRFFFGGGDKTKKALEKQRAEMQKMGAKAETGGKVTFQQRLEEALRQAQQAAQPERTRMTEEPVRSELPQPRPAMSAPTMLDAPTILEQYSQEKSADGTNDSYAFHTATKGPGDGIDYDLNSEPFSYHAPLNETEAQTFHLAGFSGFHEAHGLGHYGTKTLTEGAPTEESQSEPLNLFGDGDLRRAIILHEILGRPRAMRGIRS
jgi:hypothetical protein